MKYVDAINIPTDRLTPQQIKEIRAELDDVVGGPGKFESEPIYAPWFWACGLEGGADEEFLDKMVFVVTKDDRILFPELEGVAQLEMYEDGNGFVTCETIKKKDQEEE